MCVYWKYQQRTIKTNSLLNLLINDISERSVPQLLSIKGEWTFLFLMIGLCNSSAKSWFEIFSFLILLPRAYFFPVACVGKLLDHSNEEDFLWRGLFATALCAAAFLTCIVLLTYMYASL